MGGFFGPTQDFDDFLDRYIRPAMERGGFTRAKRVYRLQYDGASVVVQARLHALTPIVSFVVDWAGWDDTIKARRGRLERRLGLPDRCVHVHNCSMFVKDEQQQILNDVGAAIRATLLSSFGRDIEVVLGPASDDGSDAVLVVANEAPPVPYDVEVKATVTPTTVTALGPRSERRLVLFTPRLTSAVMDVCRRLGVGCADADGNVYLRAGSSVIDIGGRPVSRSRALTKRDEKRTRLSSRSGLQVLFVLLSAPERLDEPMRSVAAASGVSLGTVAGVFDELGQRRHLVTNSRGRSLQRTRELVDLWTEGYRARLHAQLRLGRFDAASKDWWRTSAGAVRDAGGQWGSETALWARGASLRPARGIVYVDTVRPALVGALRLSRDDRPDAAAELRRRFWATSTFGESDTVPPLLVYADLLADGDPRLIEAAAELRESDVDLRRLDRS